MTVILQKTDIHATLCTWLYCHFHMMYNAEKKGFTPYINWHRGKISHPNGAKTIGSLIDLYDADKFNEIPNQYEWYFKQPFADKPIGLTETWIWEFENWGCGINTTNYQLISEPLQVIKDYYKKHLYFNDYVNKRGQEIVDKYKIDFSKTIGITVRGTDNVTDGRVTMPIEAYFKYIDMAIEKIPDAKIMCTAEEKEVLQPLLDKYPQAFNIDEFYSSPKGSLQNPERHIPISGFERGLQPVLMVWLFSKCAWYIKNRSSTGAVASWLSDGQIVCLAHAETLNYDKMDNEVEINGKRFPL
jgi:hypothetical protein